VCIALSDVDPLLRSAVSRLSHGYAVARGTDISFEGKADCVPRKLPSDFVSTRESRSCQTAPRSSREPPVW
jgi:hypothetical protein